MTKQPTGVKNAAERYCAVTGVPCGSSSILRRVRKVGDVDVEVIVRVKVVGDQGGLPAPVSESGIERCMLAALEPVKKPAPAPEPKPSKEEV